MRNHAQRAAQAAKDIRALIVNSSGHVRDGVDLVNKAGQSLGGIVASIRNVATIVAEIASASTEQSNGIEQVNRALSQMDEVTQQNSALVEENSATAKTLEDQARSMDARVATFRLLGDASAEGAAVPPAAVTIEPRQRPVQRRRQEAGPRPDWLSAHVPFAACRNSGERAPAICAPCGMVCGALLSVSIAKPAAAL